MFVLIVCVLLCAVQGWEKCDAPTWDMELYMDMYYLKRVLVGTSCQESLVTYNVTVLGDSEGMTPMQYDRRSQHTLLRVNNKNGWIGLGKRQSRHVCDPRASELDLLQWLSVPTILQNTTPPVLDPVDCDNGLALFDVFLFSHELDTLEIRLFELWDVVDEFHIVENTFDFRGAHRAPVLYNTSRMHRFERFASKMVFHINRASFSESDSGWSFEDHSTAFAVKVANALDGIVIFGHVDEIPLRHAAQELRRCGVQLPLNFASWMPLGTVDMKFKTDFPARGYPYTIGEPSADHGQNVRGLARGQHSNVIHGGFHASNYCYMPDALLKDRTKTLDKWSRPEFDQSHCVSDFLKQCNRFHADRKVKVVTADNFRLPWVLDQNREAYAAWFGRVDARLTSDVWRGYRSPFVSQ